jgi:tetratricopeptide (TPR) repeat protein
VGTGRALTERGRFGAFTGDIVASAERALAATGVGIDEATDRQIQHAFRIERPAPGEAGPRRVVGSFAEPGPAAAWAPLRRRTPTAGRDVEMAQLRDLFERAADERSPASALVHGPPGAGKTRLCWDLVHWLHQLGEPTVVLQGRGDVARCYRSWAAFASALRPLAGLDDVPRDGDAAGERAGEMQRRLLRMCAEAGLAGGTSADAPAFLGELLGVPFPETPALRAARYDARVLRDQVQMAVGALVDALAAHATVVLVLEDLHVADTPSLELADYLLLGPRPLLLVGTARPHILSERPHLLPGAVRLELRPLPRRAVRQIVRGVLGRDDDAIAERAAGNPYFAEELALGALEDEARGGAPPRELPLTVQGAVQARLDHLPAEEKDLVKRAAVLGVRFWADALAELGAPAPAPALARLRRRGLVEPLPSSALAGCAEWTFHQAPLQEVAHAMLTPSQAEALHRAAANWLQRRADAPDEQVAAHLEAAGAPEEAAPLWARAAETADARGMSEAVLDQAARALPWVGDPAARLRLHDLRCQALFFMGRMDERLREIEAMEALAEHVGGGAPALVAYRRAHQLRRMGRVAEAADLTRAALARARAGADEEWTVRLLGLLAGALVEHGRPAEAVPLADEALARARARGEPVLLRDAIEWRAYVAGWAGDPCTSLRLYQETARLMTAAGDVRRAAAARMNAGMSLSQLAAWSAARAEFEASIEMCDRLGLARTRGYALDGLAIALLHGGDAAGARAAVEAALALVELSGDVRLRVSALVDRSAVRLAAGDARGALEDAQAALAAEPVAEMDAAPRATLARALLATGDAAGALREAERAISRRAAGAPVEQLEVEAHLCAHDALVALGRAAEASAAAVCAGAVVRARAERLDDAEQRAVFERHAPHARAVALAAAAAAANPAPAAPAP